MVDVALQEGAVVSVEAVTRARVLDRLRLGDVAFRHVTRAAAFGVLLLLERRHRLTDRRLAAGVQGFRLRLPDERALESGYREVRRACADLRHARDLVHRHADRGPDRTDDRLLPHRIVPAMAAAADRHRHRTARRHPQHHLRDLGAFRFCSVPARDVAAVPDRYARQRAGHRATILRTALRHRHTDRGTDPGHHGAAVRDLDLARRVRGGAAGAQGGGLRRRLHDLGGGALRRAALCQGRRHRRRDARPRPRASARPWR